MSDIDDPSSPRFFSQKKSEMDDILSDIDNDLSDDVLDIESFDDMPAEPLKASKSFRGSKPAFGKSLGGSNFMGGLSASRQSLSSKLLAGTVLAILVVGGAGAAYFYFTQDSYDIKTKIAAPLAPPPGQDMMPPNADGTMPTAPGMDAGAMPSPDGAPPVAGAPNLPGMPNDPNTPTTTAAGATPEAPPQDSLLPQVASDVAPPANDANAPATPADPTKADATKTDTPKTDAVKTADASSASAATGATPAAPAPADASATAGTTPAAAPDPALPPLPQDGIVAPKAEPKGATTVTPEEKTDATVSTDTTKTTDVANANTDAMKTDSATAIKAESKTDKVTKPSTKSEKIKYFDSPPGEFLEDIQPPSIDVSRNPGESMIIVTKPPGYEDSGYIDGAYSRKGDGTVRIERENDATNTMAQKAVMADRALRLGRYDMALDYYQEILSQNPNDVTALLGRAISWQKSGNADAAMQGYRDVLRRDPSNVTAATNLAGLQSAANPKGTYKNLTNVADATNNPVVRAQMGVSMADAGDVEDAYNVFLNATKTDPQNPVHYFNLAVTAEKLGRNAEAVAAYEKCLEVDAIYGTGRAINRDVIYDRLSKIRR